MFSDSGPSILDLMYICKTGAQKQPFLHKSTWFEAKWTKGRPTSERASGASKINASLPRVSFSKIIQATTSNSD